MLCSNASKAGNSTNRKLAFNTLEKMKYYLIAGEASGDLHASRLMKALKETDKEAEFRFFGGDKMAAEGGVLVKHYKDLAYMGFVPVLLHLPTIFRNMAFCKRDIRTWNPDAVILIDYPGFNLSIANMFAPTQRYRSITISLPKYGLGKNTASGASREMLTRCFASYPLKCLFMRVDTGSPCIM